MNRFVEIWTLSSNETIGICAVARTFASRNLLFTDNILFSNESHMKKKHTNDKPRNDKEEKIKKKKTTYTYI